MRWSRIRLGPAERRLAAALELLAGMDGSGELERERRAQLLTELVTALEARDPYTHGHSHRVARHAAMIATGLGLAEAEVAKVRTAAALHDVGKINTPRAILCKPGGLTEAELGMIKLHVVDGAEMLSTLGDSQLTAMVRHHHERLDGTGYPDRLGGDEIPLGARIIAIADTFDAITSTRPYRPANARQEALEILRQEAGSRLDAPGVKVFCASYSRRRRVLQRVAGSGQEGRTSGRSERSLAARGR